VRSYAQALGIDGDAAAARFKRETPDVDEPFHDPIGVAHDKPRRSPLIIAVIALLLSGVVLWNVVQRAMVQEDRETSSLPAAAAEPAAPPAAETTVAIGAATPAPAAQNLPEPYKVPGLDAPAPEMKGGVPVAQTASVAGAPSAAPTAETPALFKAQGAVFGAPEGPTTLVVLQARKPASLIVRGGGGAVYFARQLAVGEAYRAPEGQGLTAEVADPAAFTLYVAGENKGVLVSQQTALDKLAVRPAAPGAAPPPVHAAIVHRTPERRPASSGGDPYQAAPKPDPRGDVAYYPRQPGL